MLVQKFLIRLDVFILSLSSFNALFCELFPSVLKELLLQKLHVLREEAFLSIAFEAPDIFLKRLLVKLSRT